MVWDAFIIAPQYSFTAGLGKSLLHDKLNIKIDMNDLFHTEHTAAKIRYTKINAEFKLIKDT